MATQIKKGTEIWYFGPWNDRATVYVRRLTVTSWGKEQGTAVCTEDGKPVQHRFYTNPDKPYNQCSRVIPVTDMPDPMPEAMRRAVQQKADNLKAHINRIHHYCLDDRTDTGYFVSMKKGCQALLDEEPAVRFF